MDCQGKTGCSTKKLVGCAYGPHSVYCYIFICATFLLQLLVHQYRSAKLSSASAVKWESLSRGDTVWNWVKLSLPCHSACKTNIIGQSGRWSNTSIQMGTTDLEISVERTWYGGGHGEPCCPWLREGWKAGRGSGHPVQIYFDKLNRLQSSSSKPWWGITLNKSQQRPSWSILCCAVAPMRLKKISFWSARVKTTTVILYYRH